MTDKIQRSTPANEVDLLVLGGGMAGLAAAGSAAQAGVSVALVEKAPRLGGSAVYAGYLWTTETLETMRAINPRGDAALTARLVDGYPNAMEWVRSLDVTVKDPVTIIGYGRGCETDMAGLLSGCERVVRGSDRCEIILEARTDELLYDGGRVKGAQIVTASGQRRQIAARSTLLATGGFAGDPALRQRYIHPLASEMPLRANPYSSGDGLRLGLAVGGTFGQENAGFYGHLVPSHVAFEGPHDVLALSFFHSEHGVLLNLDGHRFIDETIGDHLNTMAALEQPEARVLLVCDQRVHDEWMLKPYVEGGEAPDRFAHAYRRGARCAVADDLDEFADLPAEWGFHGQTARQSMYDFNRGCAAGEPDPPRQRDSAPLIAPPYYLIELVPAITFPFGGLLTDDHARVLGRDGKPIPGLLAAGGDQGGLWMRAYAGGAASALVYGLQAAKTLLEGSSAE
jgi:succinate dehydrogenase/fumarate reductase flavoprotein subunit